MRTRTRPTCSVCRRISHRPGPRTRGWCRSRPRGCPIRQVASGPMSRTPMTWSDPWIPPFRGGVPDVAGGVHAVPVPFRNQVEGLVEGLRPVRHLPPGRHEQEVALCGRCADDRGGPGRLGDVRGGGRGDGRGRHDLRPDPRHRLGCWLGEERLHPVGDLTDLLVSQGVHRAGLLRLGNATGRTRTGWCRRRPRRRPTGHGAGGRRPSRAARTGRPGRGSR